MDKKLYRLLEQWTRAEIMARHGEFDNLGWEDYAIAEVQLRDKIRQHLYGASNLVELGMQWGILKRKSQVKLVKGKILKVKDERKDKWVVVGKIVQWKGNKVFVRAVKPEHYMRIEKGYGLQMTAINLLANIGKEAKTKPIKYVYLVSPQITYKSKLKQWFGPDTKTRNYKHGVQIFLKKSAMKKVKTSGLKDII